MKNKYIRSPFFYVGDKFKLMKYLDKHFPENINRFIEPFTGGGTVFLNVEAKEFLLNDIDSNIVSIHKVLEEYSKNKDAFYKRLDETIEKYGLSKSFREDIVPKELKKEFVKTYYSKFNKKSYDKLKNDYNSSKEKDPFILYLLLIYGFNRMIRYNKKGEFNLPVGNVDFNKNVYSALNNYFLFNLKNKLTWHNEDFTIFLDNIKFQENDFVYLDPPYLISFSEYNKLWNEEKEVLLLDYLDKLNEKGIKFAISNIIFHKGKENKIFKNWMQKYIIHKIESNYISYHDNTNKEIHEVLITNY